MDDLHSALYVHETLAVFSSSLEEMGQYMKKCVPCGAKHKIAAESSTVLVQSCNQQGRAL
jgi:hypothetical protein